MTRNLDAWFLMSCLGIISLLTAGFFATTLTSPAGQEEPKVTILAREVDSRILLNALSTLTGNSLIGRRLPGSSHTISWEDIPVSQALEGICRPLGLGHRVFPEAWVVADQRILEKISSGYQLVSVKGTDEWGTISLDFQDADVRDILRITARSVNQRGLGEFRVESPDLAPQAIREGQGRDAEPGKPLVTRWRGMAQIKADRMPVGRFLNALCLAFHGSPGELRDGMLTCPAGELPPLAASRTVFIRETQGNFDYRLDALVGCEGRWLALVSFGDRPGTGVLEAQSLDPDVRILETSDRGLHLEHLESGQCLWLKLGERCRRRNDGQGLEVLP